MALEAPRRCKFVNMQLHSYMVTDVHIVAIFSLRMVVLASIPYWPTLFKEDSRTFPTSPDIQGLVERDPTGSQEGLQPRLRFQGGNVCPSDRRHERTSLECC
jgi:hypothetical protein